MAQCFVDGEVADWLTDEEDMAGADVAALVVYHPDISKRDFDDQVDRLDLRCEARTAALLAVTRPEGGRFGVLDDGARARADEAVASLYGDSFLETFLNDTLSVALERTGAAFEAARRLGVRVSPGSAGESVSVIPARSFPGEKQLAAYLANGRGRWRPSVRLSVKVSFDGPFRRAEDAVAILRGQVSACGPVTEWRVRVRPCRARNLSARSARPRVVSG